MFFPNEESDKKKELSNNQVDNKVSFVQDDYEPDYSTICHSEKYKGYNHLEDQRKNKNKRKLKINKGFQPDAIIDLHGDTREQAINKVKVFIQRSIKNQLRSILIITGQGLGSGEKGAVLKQSIWSYLQHNKIRDILKFQWAPSHLGGKGAILVILK